MSMCFWAMFVLYKVRNDTLVLKKIQDDTLIAKKLTNKQSDVYSLSLGMAKTVANELTEFKENIK
jgi:hypothetical protein